MKEKRKKIVARVGAIVAVVLLVALCALPAFADGPEGARPPDALDSFPEWRLKELFYEAYGMDMLSDPLRLLMESTDYTYGAYSYLSKFTVVPVGTIHDWNNYITLTSANRTEYLGLLMVAKIGPPNYEQLFEDIWVTTSHTTSSGNKFVYFDFEQMNQQGTMERVLRIRIKINNSTGEVIDTELSGAFGGSASNYVFATALDETNIDVIQYGISQDFLRPIVNTKWDDFLLNLNVGYLWGYDLGTDYNFDNGWRIGYNKGLSQTDLIDGVTAIFRAPMELINSVLNFEIFGINMAVAVRVLISMAILGTVIAVIWKAVK